MTRQKIARGLSDILGTPCLQGVVRLCNVGWEGCSMSGVHILSVSCLALC